MLYVKTFAELLPLFSLLKTLIFFTKYDQKKLQAANNLKSLQSMSQLFRVSRVS